MITSMLGVWVHCFWNFENWLNYGWYKAVIGRLICCTWLALIVLYYIKINLLKNKCAEKNNHTQFLEVGVLSQEKESFL